MMTRCFTTPAALALSSALLLACIQPGRAAGIAPASVAAATAQSSSQFAPDARPAASAPAQDLCPAGMAGFGWG